MATATKIRTWGSSLGIIIPRELVKKENLHNNDEVFIEVKKKKTLKEIFGKGKMWNIDTQKMKDELRKEWNK